MGWFGQIDWHVGNEGLAFKASEGLVPVLVRFVS
jgi:hypothetical protein